MVLTPTPYFKGGGYKCQAQEVFSYDSNLECRFTIVVSQKHITTTEFRAPVTSKNGPEATFNINVFIKLNIVEDMA